MRRPQHRLDEPVREPEHQEVLHRLLAEEVVDAEDLVFPPALVQLLVELERSFEIRAERLLDHEPAPAVGLVAQARPARSSPPRRRTRPAAARDRRSPVRRARPSARAATATERSPPWNSMRSMNLSRYLSSYSRAGEVDRGAQVLVELIGRPVLARVSDDPEILRAGRGARATATPGTGVGRRDRPMRRARRASVGCSRFSSRVRSRRRLRAPHVAGHVAEEAGVEDAFGEPPRAVDVLEPIEIFAGQDRLKPLSGHLQHGKRAARGGASRRRPARSRS